MIYNVYMENISHIQNLGFSIYESKIILALLEVKEPTAKDIAQLSLVPKNKVYEILENLQSDSVVEVLQTKPKRFRLLELEKCIAQIEQDRMDVYKVSSTKVHSLIKKKKENITYELDIWTTEGERAMLTKVNQVLKSTQKESIAFIDVWAESRENYKTIEKAIARGVKFYFLGPLNTQSKQIIKNYIKVGVEVRAYPVEAAGYSIFDSKRVQMRVSSKKVISVWIHNKYLATILREHFFHNWKKAKIIKA